LNGVKLSYANLNGADLSNVNLSGANLNNANLSNANLSNADLISANLSNANLDGANLSNANLDDANLKDSSLISANLSGANLKDASLIQTNLQKAKLHQAKLSRSNLAYAKLNQADLFKADLRDANLARTDLTDAILNKTNLEGTILSLTINSHISNEGIQAPYQWKSFYFRSKTEIKIAQALDRAGVLFYPNCKARLTLDKKRGSKETNFLVFHRGKWGILEVDSEQRYRASSAATDSENLREAALGKPNQFKVYGIGVVEHYNAARCWSQPDKVVEEFLNILSQT
jgi:hypothetical protein